MGDENEKNRRDDSSGTNNRHSSEASLDTTRRIGTVDVLTPEIVESLKQERSQVDVNVLLVQIVNKSGGADEVVERSEKILKLAQQFEEQRLKSFKERANAIIDIRLRDPDEIEKRKNNGVRRFLKIVLASSIILGIAGTVITVYLGSNILLAGILAVITGLGIAVSAPLAAGESVSSNDVIRIFGAVKGVLSPQKPEQPSSRSSGRRGKR